MKSDENSSDEGSITNSHSELDLETDVLNPSNITAYDFEQEISAESSGGSGSKEECNENDSGDENNPVRIGNTTWCTCTCCRSMGTHQESLCCKEDVSEEILGDNTFITQQAEFAIVCLNVAVLRITLSMLNNLRGDRIEYENNLYRSAAYRQFK